MNRRSFIKLLVGGSLLAVGLKPKASSKPVPLLPDDHVHVLPIGEMGYTTTDATEWRMAESEGDPVNRGLYHNRANGKVYLTLKIKDKLIYLPMPK